MRARRRYGERKRPSEKSDCKDSHSLKSLKQAESSSTMPCQGRWAPQMKVRVLRMPKKSSSQIRCDGSTRQRRHRCAQHEVYALPTLSWAPGDGHVWEAFKEEDGTDKREVEY